MSDFIKLSELGKCYNKTADGRYRLFKVEGLWAIYLVGRELIWNEAGTDYVSGSKLVATFGGYISEKDNFEIGVAALKEEAAYLDKQLAEEFSL